MSSEGPPDPIDGVDERILALLQERARLVQQQAERARAQGLDPGDWERQRHKLERLEQLASLPGSSFPAQAARAIFRDILSACNALERLRSVAYMGPPGTFSHIAARAAFGVAAEYLELSSIPLVIDAVARGAVQYGVVPIENSTEGGVTATLDSLIEADVVIAREFVIDVPQCLIGREADLAKIQRVHSHPQPLAQCRSWLARNLPQAELLVAPSTAAAARQAAEEAGAAAIGSSLLAELYDLRVIRQSVQDRPENATRFVVLGKTHAERTGADKTSLVFSAAHTRGALRRALEIFDEEGLNLTRIESRPALGKRWEYVFFTDLEGHREDAAVERAIERLRAGCSMVKVLGSYPRSEQP